MKVRLKAGHPHAGEIGYIALVDGKPTITRLAGCDMYKVTLEDCQHGVEACFAEARQFIVLQGKP